MYLSAASQRKLTALVDAKNGQGIRDMFPEPPAVTNPAYQAWIDALAAGCTDQQAIDASAVVYGKWLLEHVQ